MPSLSSSDVTTALGFTPYNATNPNGYTNNTGTITGVTGSDGLTGSGTSGSVTIKHAAPSTSPATTTSAIYPITIDKYGHITAKGSAVTSMPASDVSAWAKTASKPTYTAAEVGALPDDTTIADHSITTPTGGTSRTTDVTLNTATVLSSVKSAGAVPTLGTAIPADDITA